MRKLSSIAYDVAVWSCPVFCLAGIASLIYAVVAAKDWALPTGIWLFFVGLLLWLTANVGSLLSGFIVAIRQRGPEVLRKNPGQMVWAVFGLVLLLYVGGRLAWHVMRGAGLIL
jgi:hypothetical protein